MAFRRSCVRLARWACCVLWLPACAHDPRAFRLRAPVLRDQDLDAVYVDCTSSTSQRGVQARSCVPETYESSFSWDAVDNSLFRPMSKFFQVDSYGEAENVNAFDEVPDSSWFTNRIGARPLSPDEVALGYCAEGPELEFDPPDGSWLVDHGKDNGANPGFRVNAQGSTFLLKTDDAQVERATAAAAIASRLYYAAGWWAPCDSVVYFKKSALKFNPGLNINANLRPARTIEQNAHDRMLA